MTKEECIALLERYAEYDGMGIPNLAGCREAMKMAADLLSQPSLPDNLDEAAREIVIKMNNIEKIRQEIKRRIKSCKTKNGFPAGTISAIRIETYEGLLAFIDSLQ